MDDVVIRSRRADDLDGCVTVLRAVHDADAYPLNWPADPRGWLTPPGLLRAWVAEAPRGVLAGHVAIHRASGDVGVEPSAELSRLYVSPAARRRSVATALLHRASEWAARNGLRLTLNVTDQRRSAAVACYEAAGWQYTRTTRADWTGPDGEPVDLRHYVQTQGDIG